MTYAAIGTGRTGAALEIPEASRARAELELARIHRDVMRVRYRDLGMATARAGVHLNHAERQVQASARRACQQGCSAQQIAAQLGEDIGVVRSWIIEAAGSSEVPHE